MVQVLNCKLYGREFDEHTWFAFEALEISFTPICQSIQL